MAERYYHSAERLVGRDRNLRPGGLSLSAFEFVDQRSEYDPELDSGRCGGCAPDSAPPPNFVGPRSEPAGTCGGTWTPTAFGRSNCGGGGASPNTFK